LDHESGQFAGGAGGERPITWTGATRSRNSTLIRSAVRRASAMPVSIGFGDPICGNRAGPATYAFGTSWKAPEPSVTDVAGSVPIHSVPALVMRAAEDVPHRLQRGPGGSPETAGCSAAPHTPPDRRPQEPAQAGGSPGPWHSTARSRSASSRSGRTPAAPRTGWGVMPRTATDCLSPTISPIPRNVTMTKLSLAIATRTMTARRSPRPIAAGAAGFPPCAVSCNKISELREYPPAAPCLGDPGAECSPIGVSAGGGHSSRRRTVLALPVSASLTTLRSGR